MNIPPISKINECKEMIQAMKQQCSQDHPMNTRLKQLSSGRLIRLTKNSMAMAWVVKCKKFVKTSFYYNLCVLNGSNS